MGQGFSGDALAGRYEVLGELGQGGMGAVYRVREPLADGREAALKVIRVPGGVTPELRLRFKQEFLAMSKLRHPNTLTVYDYGQLDDHTQYLTMELVEGRELADMLAEGRLETERTLALLTQLLQALGFIHARLYVHRDIKSQNIRVTPDGTLKLMDFGLMSQLGLPIRPGRISGSPGYMPPEAVKGGVADASSDLYSVGCLAYEMLAGRLPFEGAVMDVLRAHATTTPEPLYRLRPDLPERLLAIVAKLLEKDQRTRYQSAGEVLDDLSVITGMKQARESLAQQQSYLKSSVLVGREAELAALEDALRLAAEGQGSAVVVAASAGVGKSRLTEEFLLGAKLEDALVLTGRCLESGMAPYEPAAQALRPLLKRLSSAEGLAPLFPELGAGSLAAEEDRLRLHDAVLAAIASLDQPVVFALEDAHWADSQTVALFNHLARAGGAHRLLCLATLRSDEVLPGSPIGETTEEGTSRLLELGPLGPEQLEVLVRSLLGEVAIAPGLTSTLMDATGGNPFFLTEVLRDLMAQGSLRFADGAWRFPEFTEDLALPDSVEATVMRRVGRLSAEAAALARVAAVAGRHQTLGLLLAASELPEDALFQGLADLTAHQFLVPTDHGYAFPHDRLREALYHHQDPEARRVAHQRCADVLRAQSELDDDALFDLAHHLGRGLDREAAAHWLERAGRRAFELGAEMLAVRNWKQAAEAIEAVEAPGKAETLQRLWNDIGTVAFALAPGHGIPALERLLPTLEAMPPGPERTVALVRTYRFLSVSYALSGRPLDGFRVAEQADAQIPDDPQHPLWLLRGTIAFACYFTSGRFDELATVSRAMRARFAPYPPGSLQGLAGAAQLSTALQGLAVCHQGIRPAEEDLAYIFEVGAAIGDPEPVLALVMAAMWPVLTGRHELAEPYLDRVVQECRRMSMPVHPWLLYLRPYMLWQRGEFEAARGLLTQSFRYPHLVHMELPRQLMVTLQGQIHLDLGDTETAREAFSQALTCGRRNGLQHVTIKALIGLGRVDYMAKNWAAARRVLEEARAMAASGPARNPLEEAIACRMLAQVAIAERNLVIARPLLARAMAIVTAPEQDNLLQQGLGHQVLGDLHKAAGDTPAAGEAYRAAGECFHQLKNRHLLHGLNQRLDALLTGDTAAPAPVEAAPEDRWLQLRALQMM